jgi:hypothetical protein
MVEIIPGGILPTDHWHHVTNDDTCSRCRKPVPEGEVPLMLWRNNGDDLLIYCEKCLKAKAPARARETSPAAAGRGLRPRRE